MSQSQYYHISKSKERQQTEIDYHRLQGTMHILQKPQNISKHTETS